MTTTIFPDQEPKTPLKNFGDIHVKGFKSRIDNNGYRKTSVITDASTGQTWSLDNTVRAATDMGKKPHPSDYPACGTSDTEACFKGATKIGTEKILGHECTVYEHIYSGKTPRRVKLWRPNDLSEVAFIKSQFFFGNQLMGDTEITEIKMTPQADSYFTVPPGYEIDHVKKKKK
jgi:hypothetical protein